MGVCCGCHRDNIGVPIKHGKGSKLREEELGLWVDSALISRLHRQPSKSPAQMMLADSERMLHFADLAFGTVKPDKFKAKKVSKSRRKKE